MLKVIGGIIGIVVLLAMWNIGKAANHGQNTSNRVGPNWSSMHNGMTEQQVVNLLGNPDSKDSSNVDGDAVDDWYYGTLASTSYDVTFENGRVFSYSKLG